MRILRNLSVLILAGSIFYTSVDAQNHKTQLKIKLPNGWGITPVGKSMPLGDLPLNIAVSPSKKMIAVTNNGQSDQYIELIDPAKQILLDSVIVKKSWMGLAFSADEKSLYASAGNDNSILVFSIKDKKLGTPDTIRLGKPWPEKISPSGIAADHKSQMIFVVTRENNSLYVINAAKKEILKTISLDGEAYTCILSPDDKTLYISCWGKGKILVFNTVTNEISAKINVGTNPNDLCMSADGNFLYTANASDNSVSVIDLKKGKQIETLDAALYPGSIEGSTTNSVALSEDGKTLYIANADNNCLAVFDVTKPGESKSKGFIPTGWYPTCVRVIKNDILVSNGKGFSSFANPQGPNPTKKRERVLYQGADAKRPARDQYIGGLFKGTLSIIPIPDAKQLAKYAEMVYGNTPYHKDSEMVAHIIPGNPVPAKVGDPSPIKYVFYVIKENRTYDQVLGDMPNGNGDTSLVLFGEKITPNQHALAREFVLLDNFYADGEVSADGHNWSMGAYATDYLEKTWPTSYGGRGGGYDAEGLRDIANNKAGFIWDFCNRKGISYRSYGEFINENKADLPSLENHYCKYFTGWDLSVYDTTRYGQWKKEFDSLLIKNAVPAFNTVRFGNDHTQGMRKGKPTPYAQVADNDAAVGMFIEHLSHSPIWKESVVFIVEDDAQNGADHVDAHRTTAYVAGGFIKKGYADHTMYSTSSMIRTIELILGLPPMSQYDAAATPMWNCFATTADHNPFTARPANVNLKELSYGNNKWIDMSEGFDFTAEDRAPDRELNEVIWFAIKGPNVPCPAPKHAAFIAIPEGSDKD